jgi:hypothetical protein
LRGSDPTSEPDILQEGNAIVILLETTKSHPIEFYEEEFISAAKLRRHLKRRGCTDGRKRIYIVEGLSPDYVSVLGQHFSIGPDFFQEQQLHHGSDLGSHDSCNPLHLNGGHLRNCSRTWYNDSSFHLQYCELREFDRSIDNLPFVCPRTGRAIDMATRRISYRAGASNTTAVLRRKVSWWSRSLSDGGWDGMFEYLKPC